MVTITHNLSARSYAIRARFNKKTPCLVNDGLSICLFRWQRDYFNHDQNLMNKVKNKHFIHVLGKTNNIKPLNRW